tara:strand:- start:1345 stop:1764 length:420 start_codon:yes stop_codon:yes gene_type:complete
MEFEIVTIVMASGASFALGMYVSSQIMKDVKKRTTHKYFGNRNKHMEKVMMSVPEGKEFNKSYPIDLYPSAELKSRVKENQDKLKDTRDESEKRMDVIGQNGNDGLHYEQSDTSQYGDSEYPRTGGLANDCGPSERPPK